MAEVARNLMAGGDVPAPTSNTHIPYLRHWRLHRLLTQGQLAKASGVSVPTIIRGERSEPVFALSAAKLAKALHVTVEQLQSEKPPAPEEPKEADQP
jgi:transcriptional regulator with XRE-family HTH domain